jgi:hypothetical protein
VDPRAELAVVEVGEVAELDVMTPKPTFYIDVVGRDKLAGGVLGHSGPKYAQPLGPYGSVERCPRPAFETRSRSGST